MATDRIQAFSIRVQEPATVESCASISIENYILNTITANGLNIEDHDILIVTSKLVSIFEGRTIEIARISPSLKARLIGKVFGKDSRKVDLILREGHVRAVVPLKLIGRIPSLRAKLATFTHDRQTLERLYKSYSSAFMVKTHGILLDDAGIDLSNSPDGWVSLLPLDANVSARKIHIAISEATGKQIAVIITDSAAVFGKLGGQDVAIGCAGLDPVGRNYAAPDVFGNPKMGGLELIADPLAGIGGVLMGQTDEATPFCLIRGYPYKHEIEKEGVKILSYPRGVFVRSALYVVLATIVYYLCYILTLPLNFRKESRKDGAHGQ